MKPKPKYNRVPSALMNFYENSARKQIIGSTVSKKYIEEVAKN